MISYSENMLPGKHMYPRTAQNSLKKSEAVDICVNEERKGKRKWMNDKKEADVKNREHYLS